MCHSLGIFSFLSSNSCARCKHLEFELLRDKHKIDLNILFNICRICVLITEGCTRLICSRGKKRKSVYAWPKIWSNITSFTFNIRLYYHMHNNGTFRVHSGLMSLMNESTGRWLGDWLSCVPAEPHLHCCMCHLTESPEEQKPLIRAVDPSYANMHYGLAMTCSVIIHLNQLER